MGFKFRKSINLGNGVRLNIGKSSIGISAGTKGFRVSTNTKGQSRTTVSIPGTGISYSTAYSTSNKKKSDSTQSLKLLQDTVQNNIETINACIIAMEDTNSVSTYFSKQKMYEKKLLELCDLSKKFKMSPDPNEKLKTLKKDKTLALNTFIDKIFDNTYKKILSAKTMDARKNKCEKFYMDFNKYEEEMEPENIRQYREKYQALLKYI